MGILFGYLCLACFCILSAKWLTRKQKGKKTDTFLRKLHKPVCILFLLIVLVHIILVIPVCKTRSICVLAAGLAAAALLVCMIFFYHSMKKNHLRRLQCHRILTGLMLLCIIMHMGFYFIDFQNYQTKIREIQLEGIETARIPDGRYSGEYDAGYIYAKVQVTIGSGMIQNILLLEHRNEKGQAAEAVIPAIIDTQTFPVDAVSGATNSSYVIQKAVSNAIQNAE